MAAEGTVDWRVTMPDYEALYRAVIRRLVEIADAKDDDAMAIDEVWRLIDYDRVTRAHEPNIEDG
jgi:hypothetical protein